MVRIGASLGLQAKPPGSIVEDARSVQVGSKAAAPLGLADAVARAKLDLPRRRASDIVNGVIWKSFGSKDVIDLLSGDETDDADISVTQERRSTNIEHRNCQVQSSGSIPMTVDEDHVIVELDDDAGAEYMPAHVEGLSSAAATVHHASSVDLVQREGETTPDEGGAGNLGAAAGTAVKETASNDPRSRQSAV